MEILGIASVASITVICYLLGITIKALDINAKWIPLACGILGMILGVVGYVMGVPDYPAADCLTAAAVGIVSGLAATGIDQVFKQLR